MAGLIGLVALVGLGLALLFLRTWIKQSVESAVKSEYDRNLEQFKAGLVHQNAVEAEKLKSQLNMAAAERQLMFSRLHERRAEVIAELYKLIKAKHFAVHDYVTPNMELSGQTREKRLAVIQKLNDAYLYFHDNAIFLPRALANQMEKVIKDYRQQFMSFRIRVDDEKRDGADRTKDWIEISEAVDKLSETALPELEQELRKLLGDDSEPGSKG